MIEVVRGRSARSAETDPRSSSRVGFAVAGLIMSLAPIEREPVRMRGEDCIAPRHRSHAVRYLGAVGIAQAEPHRPQGGLLPNDAKAEIEPPQWDVGPNVASVFGNWIILHHGHDFAQFARQIPAHAEPWRKPHTALNEPRSSNPQNSSGSILSPAWRSPTGRCRRTACGGAYTCRHRARPMRDFLPLACNLPLATSVLFRPTARWA